MVGVVGSSPIAPTNLMPLLFLALITLLLTGAASAQYPSRPIRILVTIPPGGAPDIVARVVAEKISPSLGQPVVIENKPAANGNAAAAEAAHAPADGHTLLLAADSLITINPHVYASMPLDTLKDLTPVQSLVSNQFVLSINPALPPKTFPDLPTIGEFYPGFENSIWLGLFGPAGMPEEVLQRLRTEVRKALESPEVKQRLVGAGSLETLLLSPQDFNALIHRDYERFGKLIRDIGIKAD